jgi:hypothetical protein
MKLNVSATLFTVLMLLLFVCESAVCQINPKTQQQIQNLIAEKKSRTPTERKISSQLLQAVREASGRPMAKGVPLKPANVRADSTGSLQVDINAAVTNTLLAKIKALGGRIIYSSVKFHSIRAQINLTMVETIAGYPEVKFIKPAERAHVVGSGNPGAFMLKPGAPGGTKGFNVARPTAKGLLQPSFKERADAVKKQLQKYMLTLGTGTVTSQGDHTMGADSARKIFGYQGQGIRIGVLSDSYDGNGENNAAADVASGDLPGLGNPLGNTTPVTVLQDYPGTDEGRAMLQIVHDVAPKAQLFFATAYSTDAQFAENILALRTAPNNCDIIIDDVMYYDEPAYQDGIIAQAVNAVTASGALYFSAAGNGGSALMNYASIWEGDFNDAGSPLFTGDTAKVGGSIHNFGTLANPEIGDTILPTLSGVYNLKWADPIGRSSNDYDLFIVKPTGEVEFSSTDIQDGTQDPYEEIDLTNYIPLYRGYQVLVFKDSSAKPVTFVINANTDGYGPAFKYTTPGITYGHSAAANAFSVAATPAPAAYPGIFSAASQVEYFSSDGPRHIFFNADSTPVTPGNFTIATNGGTVRRKPDITAADGVSTTMGGFNPFYGTSAAAPHAGAVAALVKSANPALTAAQIRQILDSTTLDIEAPGYDYNSGYGIVQAFNAVRAANPTPLPALTLGQVTVADGAFSNHNGSIDPGETGTMVVQLLNKSLAGTKNAHARLTTSTPGVTIAQDSSWYGSIPINGSGTNTSVPFTFAVSPNVPCNGTITFFIITSADSGFANSQAYPFTITTGTTIFSNISSSMGATPPLGKAYTVISGQQNGFLTSNYTVSNCYYTMAAPAISDSAEVRQFDAYTFTNTQSTSQCVTVTVNNINGWYGAIGTAAYDSLGFVPSNPSVNFIGYPGNPSPTMQYSFSVPAGAKYTVVVNDEGRAPASGTAYSLNVTYTYCSAVPPCAKMVANTTLAVGGVGKPYNQVFTASGGSGAYTFSFSGVLPPGMYFFGNTLLGTPTQAGTFPITVTVGDPLSCNLTSVQNLVLNIAGVAPDSVVVFAGSPQTVSVTGVFANLQAKVFGAGNKPLGGVNVMFTAPTNPGLNAATGTFAGGLDTVNVITDSLGIATAPVFTADSIAGSYSVTAAVNGVAKPAEFLLSNACLTKTVVTDSVDDNGPGSLRFIVAGACPENPVTFAPAISKITLTQGEILIGHSMSINGPGANLLTLSGNNNSRIFTVHPGYGSTDSINISGVTIRDGLPQETTYSYGGGGVLIRSGNVSLNGCTITNNTSSLSYYLTGGGAVDNEGASVVINDCSIVQNQGVSFGGGINTYGSMAIYNSTIAGNTTLGSGYYGYGWGGGIYFGSGTIKLINCTVYGNRAVVGGNMYSSGSFGNTYDTLKNNIVGGGMLLQGYGSAAPDLYGSGFVSSGYNLIQDTTAGNYTIMNGFAASDITGVGPALLPLGNYGGPTPTMLPVPNSPVVNKGDPSLIPTQFDQRGYTRVAAGRADIGAVEANYTVAATAGTPQKAAVNTQFQVALQASVTENGNPMDSITVVFNNSAPETVASGTFSNGQMSDTVVTNPGGTAAATAITANGNIGTYRVTGGIGGVFASANFYLSNVKVLSVAFGNIAAGFDNCTIKITWQTVTGEAGETFTLEHSTDALNFTQLYTTASQGSSVAAQTYNYTDLTPGAGTNYYRIKETDADGAFMYSSTVIAVNTCSNAPIIAYPNPAHNTLTVVMPGTEKQAISIFDASGRLVTRYASATGTLNIDISRCAAGIYTLRVTKADKTTYEIKVVKN